MLQQCLEVFRKELELKTDKLILDTYVPADGTYVFVKPVEDGFEISKIVDVKQDKKTKEISEKSNSYFQKICNYDYNSRLVDMNKPIDTNKIIHSNNYLSFFVKKENLTNGKLTQVIIEDYYQVLSHPAAKYTKTKNALSKKGLELYHTIEKEIGQVDTMLLDKIKNWILTNIFQLDMDITGKDYLKIFFEYPIEMYQKEGKRYLVPNIYNSNDFNINISEQIYGLSNDNMGLNAKKPYLENKTRKNTVPYLVSSQDILLQKSFFDYLMNLASIGKINIYINHKISSYRNGELPDKDFNGIFLRIKKGKEVEIHDYDVISAYKSELIKVFKFMNSIKLDLSSNKVSTQKYGTLKKREDIQTVFNEVLFSKYLIPNYFTQAQDIAVNDGVIKNSLLLSRNILFNYFYKGIDNGVFSLMEKVSLSLIKGSILEGYSVRASHQFNLRWSIINYHKGGEDMADLLEGIKENLRTKINSEHTEKLEGEEEQYYFAIGQAVNFLLSKSKGKKKPLSLANVFINGKDDTVIKDKLRKLYVKYNYDIEMNSRRFKNLYAMILGYAAESKVNQDMIIAGYLSSNLIYESNKKEDKDHE